MSSWAVRSMVASALLTGGFVVGYAAHHPDPPPPARVVQVPKYLQPEDRIIEKPVMPQACKDAVRAAQLMQKAVDEYEEIVGGLPDLIDDAGVAIYTKDQAKLNKIQQKQIDLQADSVQALLNLREAKQNMDRTQPLCDSALR